MKRATIDPRSMLRLLVFGAAGSGKTTLAASACLDPRTSPVLWLDAGGQPISIAHAIPDATRYPTVLTIDSIGDLTDIYDWLANGQKANAKIAIEMQLTGPYKTLVFDGFTHIQRKSFDHVMRTEDIRPGMIPPKPEWSHFRGVGGQMLIIASKFYTLPMHVIATALEDPDDRYATPGDVNTKYTYYQPLLAGQTRDELPSWALSVGRICQAPVFDGLTQIFGNKARDEAYSVIQFERTRTVYAKDQHGLGKYFANPTVSRFLDIVYAKAPKNKATNEGGTAV